MRTQCPYCRAKFKTPDKHEGKKVKCPKCNQPFVIAPFAEGRALETCTSCGTKIGKLEQACIFDGRIVCKECDEKLRKEVKDSIGNEDGTAPHSPKLGQETRWLPLREASKAGIILASSLILGGIAMLFAKSEPREPEMREITIGGYPEIDKQGNIVGWTKQQKLKVPVDLPPDPETVRFSRLMEVGLIMGIGISLLLRSFFPGFGVGGLILTGLGGLLVGLSLGMVFAGIVCWGWPENPGVLVGSLIWALPGGVLLKYGFRPKRGLQEGPIGAQ